MFPSRDAIIERSAGSVAISTFAKHPTVEVLGYVSLVILWLGFAIFGLLAVCARISPETMTVGIQCFFVVWLLFWIIGGAFIMWAGFLRAFSRLEVLADSTGISLHRSFPMGSTSMKYSWDRIEYVSEYLEDRRPYGGVVMCVDKRLITIDERLPNRVAASIADALGSVFPTESPTPKHF